MILRGFEVLNNDFVFIQDCFLELMITIHLQISMFGI